MYYNIHARRKTVSLTINEDLHAKAKKAGLNESRIAETAIATALEKLMEAELHKTLSAEIEGYAEFAEREGRFAEKLRETDGAV
jgi:post-segregation antitoxin (ccd killing protein)